MGCILHGAVLRIVDHNLVLVGMTKEDTCNNVRRVSINDLVEQIRRIGEGVASVPTRQYVAKDPGTFAVVLRRLKLVDHPAKIPRVVWIGRVDEVEVVGAVPEVRIQSDNPKLRIRRMIDAICCIVRSRVSCRPLCDPSALLPKGSDVVVIPRLLLTQWPGKAVWSIDCFRVAICGSASI